MKDKGFIIIPDSYVSKLHCHFNIFDVILIGNFCLHIILGIRFIENKIYDNCVFCFYK